MARWRLTEKASKMSISDWKKLDEAGFGEMVEWEWGGEDPWGQTYHMTHYGRCPCADHDGAWNEHGRLRRKPPFYVPEKTP